MPAIQAFCSFLQKQICIVWLLACFVLGFQQASLACSISLPENFSDLPYCSEEWVDCSENKEWCLKSKYCVIKANTPHRIQKQSHELYHLDSSWSLFPKYRLLRSSKRFVYKNQYAMYWLSNDGWLVRHDGGQLEIYNPAGDKTARVRPLDVASEAVMDRLMFVICDESTSWLATNVENKVSFWGPFLIVRAKVQNSDYLRGCSSYREIIIEKQTGKVLIGWNQAQTKSSCENPLKLTEALSQEYIWNPTPLLDSLNLVPLFIRTGQLSLHHFRTGNTLFESDSLFPNRNTVTVMTPQ